MSTEPQIITLSADRLEELAKLGAGFYTEGQLPGSFKPEVFVRTWQALLASEAAVCFALEQQGELCGALGAIIYPDPNDGAMVATEMFWYVIPEHRRHGLRLLKAFEQWASERQARRLCMVHLTRLSPDRLQKLYHARGYRHVESHYLKEI